MVYFDDIERLPEGESNRASDPFGRQSDPSPGSTVPNVLVVVKDGVVKRVCGDRSFRVVVKDLDDMKAGDEFDPSLAAFEDGEVLGAEELLQELANLSTETKTPEEKTEEIPHIIVVLEAGMIMEILGDHRFKWVSIDWFDVEQGIYFDLSNEFEEGNACSKEQFLKHLSDMEDEQG